MTTPPATTGPRADPTGAALVAALVDPLLDARTQPAAEQFDRLVAGALADATISQDLARELRFWQRTSVHELADHVRTVLPTVLPVALASVASSAVEAESAAGSAAAFWHSKDAPVDVGEHPAAPAPAQAVVSAPEEDVDPAPHEDGTDAAPVSSPQLRRRLFVAGLTSTA